MDSNIFHEWLISFNSWISSRLQEEVALLLDNAPHHKPLESAEKVDIGSGIDAYELGRVLLIFIPPNVTSHLHPLDQALIRAVKQSYRNYFLNWSLQATHRLEGIAELSKDMPYTRVALSWHGETYTAMEEHNPLAIRFEFTCTTCSACPGNHGSWQCTQHKEYLCASRCTTADYIFIRSCIPYQVDLLFEVIGKLSGG